MSETLTRAAFSLAPATLVRNDDGTATVEATLSSGAAVTRKGPQGFFTEVLDTSPGAVRPADHIPLLDSHRQNSVKDIVGHVRGIRHEPGAVAATLLLSNPDVIAAVARGDLRGLSVGYRVTAWKDSKDSRGGSVRTATSWDLLEASLVAVPSDPSAILRSKPVSEAITDPVEMTRAETNAAIRSLAKRGGLAQAWIDEQIDTGASIDQARAAAAEAMIARSERATIRTHRPGDLTSREADWNVAARSVALAHRQQPSLVPLTEAANEYRHFSMQDHMRDCLELAGIRTRGMSRAELISRTMELSTRAYNTTSDFPLLLQDFARRLLEPRYQAAQSPFALMFAKRNAVDKRNVYRIFLSEMPQLLALTESGEITQGTRVESSVSYALKTAARQFGLTRDALLNDDLGAFSDSIGAFSAAAAEYTNQQRVALLAQNGGDGPSMSDGNPMFTAGHGNLASEGAAISVETLSAAQQAMYLQTSLDSFTPVNVKPAYLMVGPVNILTAQQVLHSLNPTQVADANPFAGNALTLLIEPRLKTSAGWYVFAAPGAHTSFEESYLEGAEGPQIETKAGWSTLGVDFRCYLDYNCGGIDWRGAYLNPG